VPVQYEGEFSSEQVEWSQDTLDQFQFLIFLIRRLKSYFFVGFDLGCAYLFGPLNHVVRAVPNSFDAKDVLFQLKTTFVQLLLHSSIL
jgi:hypothetical protein